MKRLLLLACLAATALPFRMKAEGSDTLKPEKVTVWKTIKIDTEEFVLVRFSMEDLENGDTLSPHDVMRSLLGREVLLDTVTYILDGCTQAAADELYLRYPYDGKIRRESKLVDIAVSDHAYCTLHVDHGERWQANGSLDAPMPLMCGESRRLWPETELVFRLSRKPPPKTDED